MCEDCEKYSTCISACPKKTCDNRLVYDQLMTDCTQVKDLCFEGCDLEPCPDGQVMMTTIILMVTMMVMMMIMMMVTLERRKKTKKEVFMTVLIYDADDGNGNSNTDR